MLSVQMRTVAYSIYYFKGLGGCSNENRGLYIILKVLGGGVNYCPSFAGNIQLVLVIISSD